MSITPGTLSKKEVSELVDALRRHHYPKASRVLQHALQDSLKTNGPDSRLLEACDHMADFLAEEERYQEAASLYRLLMEARTKASGESDPSVATYREKLISVLSATGGITQASCERESRSRKKKH
ncbi:MAG TPA: hypothetical protein V6D17_00985 [Candidatus Obscuribacterales bacterium]